MIMMMKKQQWMMFKQVFSMINSSSSSSRSSSSSSSSISAIFNNNNVLLGRRPFCCSTTTTTTTTPTPTTPPVNNNNKQFNMLLEKKHPLLLVPYDHITPKKKEYVLRPPERLGVADYYICDGTFGFVNVFHDDDDDDDDNDDEQLVINKKKKKKEVYDVYLPEIAKRKICGSSEGWLVTVHWNGEFQLLNPVTRAIVHLPPFRKPLSDFIPYHPATVKKVVTNTTTTTTTTTNSTTTLPVTVTNTVVLVMAIQGDLDGCLSFCWTSTSSSSTGNGTTDETTTAAAWIEIPVKIPMSTGLLNFSHIDESDIDQSDIDQSDQSEEHPEIFTYEVIDGVTHGVTMLTCWADVTFYQGNFYTVGPFGMVGVVKGLDGPSPFVQFLIDFDHPCENQSHICYLVESVSSSSSSSGGGDLLMVMRNVVDETKTETETETETEEEEEEETFERPYRTNGFRVLKLDLNNGPPSWEEVTDLGEDCALFVGYNHSFSLSASKISGCRGNCIYFTDGHHDCNEGFRSYPNGGHDIGVYKLEDASFEKLDYETCSSQLIMPPPVWYVPN